MSASTREVKRAQVSMGRRFGASPEAREKMAAADDEATWVGQCPRCHMALKGTLKFLKGHKCGT